MAAKTKTTVGGPPHPGVALAETVLAKLSLTQDQLAKLTGVSRRTINQLVNFRRNLTADMALRIAKVTGTSARDWLDQQMAYDLSQAEVSIAQILAELPGPGAKPARITAESRAKVPTPVKLAPTRTPPTRPSAKSAALPAAKAALKVTKPTKAEPMKAVKPAKAAKVKTGKVSKASKGSSEKKTSKKK